MEFHSRDWAPLVTTAIVGGLVAGIVMGAILQAGTSVLSTIGAVTGSESVVAGWIIHLVLSVLFAGVFLVALASRPIEVAFRGSVDTVLLGIVYGALLASATWGFVIPASMGFHETFPLDLSPEATSVAWFSIVLAIGHLAYGAILGTIVVLRHSPMPLFADEDQVEGERRGR